MSVARGCVSLVSSCCSLTGAATLDMAAGVRLQVAACGVLVPQPHPQAGAVAVAYHRAARHPTPGMDQSGGRPPAPGRASGACACMRVPCLLVNVWCQATLPQLSGATGVTRRQMELTEHAADDTHQRNQFAVAARFLKGRTPAQCRERCVGVLVCSALVGTHGRT